MLVETSAIVAILLNEPEHDQFVAEISAAPKPMTTVVNAIEATLGVGKEIRDYARAGKLVRDFLSRARVEILDVRPIFSRMSCRPMSATARAPAIRPG